MTEELFLNDIREILELEDQEMHINDDFRSYEQWDSLSFLALVTHMRDEYQVLLDIDTFNTISSWQDLYQMISK